MIISSNIKKHRELKNYTQEELANQMNISRQSISKWERGDALPSIDNLIRLSDLLDLSLDELIMNRGELPLPLDYGKFKSKKIFVLSMIFPLLMIINGIYYLQFNTEGWFMIGGGLFLGALINEINLVDLRRMYNYFTMTKTGIEYFDSNIYMPKIVWETMAFFGKRRTKFIDFKEIEQMEIYFDNKGYEGQNTTVAYRPRQMFYNREAFLLRITLKSGELVKLNLDKAFFPDSDERRYFCALFEYFESRNILVSDPYHILSSIRNEYSIVEEAYKLKVKGNK